MRVLWELQMSLQMAEYFKILPVLCMITAEGKQMPVSLRSGTTGVHLKKKKEKMSLFSFCCLSSAITPCALQHQLD